MGLCPTRDRGEVGAIGVGGGGATGVRDDRQLIDAVPRQPAGQLSNGNASIGGKPFRQEPEIFGGVARHTVPGEVDQQS